ncbi:hypothetical protein [Priestia megaterium]|nr:hypothetical protein [Priestia megaterium]QSX24239.1 hypothetical protein J0P05_31890 [Priestia megaterium]
MRKWLCLSFMTLIIILCAACSDLTWKKEYASSISKELLSEGEEYSILVV